MSARGTITSLVQGTRTTFEPGTVLSGKLRVVRTVGTGAMGAVYEVEHLITKHHRALKVLHRDLIASGSAVARLIREAGVAGRLGTDRVVQTFDVGQLEDGAPYVLMELLRGKTLGDVLSNGALVPGFAVHVVREIAAGMAFAHDHGIVHRDLKPANVFLAENDVGDVQVKILDFGISKFTMTDESMAKGLTVEGVVVGTPYYMSPEQAGAESDVDHRTDIYALGVMLYECLTGALPYKADTFPALMAQIHMGKYVPIDTLPSGLDPNLAAIVHRAIHKERDGRFASMEELSAALEPYAKWSPDATLLDAPAIHARPRFEAPTIAADDLVPPPTPRVIPPPPPSRVGGRSGLALAGGVAVGLVAAGVAAYLAMQGVEPETSDAPTPPPLVVEAEVDAGAPVALLEDAGAPDAGVAEAVAAPAGEPSGRRRRGFRHAREQGLRTDNPYGD